MARPSIEQRQTQTAAIRPLFQTLKEQGRMQAWLARQLGISDTTLWNYAHGERRPPAGLIARACAAIGVTPEEIGLNPVSIEREESRQRRQHQRRPAAPARGSTYHGNSANLDDTRPQSLTRSARPA